MIQQRGYADPEIRVLNDWYAMNFIDRLYLISGLC
jgi:hypothetical protein